MFHSVQHNLVAQTGDPTYTGKGGESIFYHLYGEQAKYFEAEMKPRVKHKKRGTVSMVNNGNNQHGSQFFITLAEDLDYLDGVHTVFGEISEGFEILDKMNEAHTDSNHRPYVDIRIYHTIILNDPYEDPAALEIPDKSPELTKEQLASVRIAPDEKLDDTEGKTTEEVEELMKSKESKANAMLLEMIGDLPDQDVKPPDNVLFVCKLNPVTTQEDLEIIFSRFGGIECCEVIKDQRSGESLQYAFIEFESPDSCEKAYFKMDNVLIDDRRIHVDFSQSVSKVKWKGKGKGVVFPNQSAKNKLTRRSRSPPVQSHKSSKRHRSRSPSLEIRKKTDKYSRRSPSPVSQRSKDKTSSRKNRDRRERSSSSPVKTEPRRRSISSSPPSRRDKKLRRSSSRSQSINEKADTYNRSENSKKDRNRIRERSYSRSVSPQPVKSKKRREVSESPSPHLKVNKRHERSPSSPFPQKSKRHFREGSNSQRAKDSSRIESPSMREERTSRKTDKYNEYSSSSNKITKRRSRSHSDSRSPVHVPVRNIKQREGSFSDSPPRTTEKSRRRSRSRTSESPEKNRKHGKKPKKKLKKSRSRSMSRSPPRKQKQSKRYSDSSENNDDDRRKNSRKYR